MYNEGISKNGDLLDLGVEYAVVEKRGAFYSFGDTRLGQGRENAKIFLGENPAIAAEIDGRIRATGGLPVNLSRKGGGATEDSDSSYANDDDEEMILDEAA